MARKRDSIATDGCALAGTVFHDSNPLPVPAMPKRNSVAKYRLRGESEHAIQTRILHAIGAQSSTVKTDKNGSLKAVKINLFRSKDGMFWRNNTGVAKTLHGAPIAFGCPGSGDILGVFKGKPIAIEVKSETGKQSAQQQSWQQSWEESGGIYILARSPGDVLNRLGEL